MLGRARERNPRDLPRRTTTGCLVQPRPVPVRPSPAGRRDRQRDRDAAQDRPAPGGSQEEWDQRNQAYGQIAALVDELRTAYPDDPRVARYLPERWECLAFLQKRADIHAEIDAVLRTSTDPVLKKEALLFDTCLRFL